MEKKIANLKTAYQKRDDAKLLSAARALIAYAEKHPFAAIMGTEREEIVRLARKIVSAA